MESIARHKGTVPRDINHSSLLPDGCVSPLDTLLVGLKDITQDCSCHRSLFLVSVILCPCTM